MVKGSACILFMFASLAFSASPGNYIYKNSKDSSRQGCIVTEVVKAECMLQNTTHQFYDGQSCQSKSDLGPVVEYKCLNGQWITEKYDIGLIREKREAIIDVGLGLGTAIGAAIGGPAGAAIGGAAGLAVGAIVCIFICEKEGPEPNQPPTIDCNSFEDIQDQYIAPENTTEFILQLGNYKGKDPEDGDIEVTTPQNPVHLQRGTNIITFQGQDSNGLPAFCTRQVFLKVITCAQPEWPQNGFVYCKHGEVIKGSTCSIKCNEGFSLKGASNLKCIGEGKYDQPTPTCTMVHCSNTSNIQPQHGHAYCEDKTFPFGSVCVTDCKRGYGAETMMFSRCKANQQWSSQLPPCEDKEPPFFTYCPSTIHAYADKGKDQATVTWTEPTAEDNSGEPPLIRRITGNPSGSLFLGFTEISYTAKDNSGNESPKCTFFIFVDKQFCDPPVFNTASYLRYNCGQSGYQYGSECDIQCDGSYPLVGNNKMICEKNMTSAKLFWDWGDQEKPYCKQNICPQLPAPKNGALTCDKWMYGTQCTMQCNEKYDIPVGVGGGISFTGLYTCSTAVGKWSPLQTVPDCSERRMGQNHRLPAELTYSGDCNDETTKTQIKQNFINVMQGLENDPGYKSVCPSADTCNVENVEIICGTTRRKRQSARAIFKRATNNLITLTFEFVRKYEAYGNGTMTAYNNAKAKFEVLTNLTNDMINKGLLDIPNTTIDKSSLLFGSVDIDCGPGRFPKYSTLTCGACAGGSYLLHGACVLCPVGTYKNDEDAVTCTACPSGKSTEDTGAKDVAECKEICTPGLYSPNGLEPCTPCPVGTFSDRDNSTQCTACPINKFTQKSGSTQLGDCSDFDIHLRDASVDANLRPNITGLQTMTLSFWFKLTNDKSSLDINIGGAMGFSVVINSMIQLQYAKQDLSTGIDIEKLTWTQFVLMLDSTSNLLCYINGKQAFNKQVVTTKLEEDMVKLNSHFGVELSGFFITEDPITPTTVQHISKSCENSVSNTLLTTIDFLKSNTTDVVIQTPSVCDAVNECLPNPCNNQICQNKLNGYYCICSGGFTGRSCEIPPDFCANNDCENGATCENNNHNYTCKCPPRIKGTFCEIVPVDGQWSEWDDWGQCSVSCGGGQQQRHRNCTNPAPGPDGNPCVGISVETKSCNPTVCPTCPSPPRAYGLRMNCTVYDDTTKCLASCRDGLTFAPGYPALDEYQCGKSTNYIWNGHPPSCAQLGSPKAITVQSELQYPDFPCNDVATAKTEIYNNAKNDLQCGKNGTCEIQISIKGCEKRHKRSTEAVAVITLSIPLTEGDNLELDKYTGGNTISPALVSLLKAVADLEVSAQEINNTKQVFQVNGITTDLGKLQVKTSSQVKCLPGQIRLQAFCVDCPTGTYNRNQDDHCKACNFGTYQDLTGQIVCKSCPDGYTTDIVGSQSQDMCTVKRKVAETTEQKGSDTTTIAIAVTLAVLSAAVVGIVAGLVIRKQMRTRYRKNYMGSNVSINMIKPSVGNPSFFK